MTTLRKVAQFTAASIRYYVSAITSAAILCHATANTMGAEAVSARSWVAEKDAAVRLARNGDTAAALTVLERLRREHPADPGVARDLVVVSAWAGRDAEAVRLFVALKQGPQPYYVMAAVALAYRHLGQLAAALAIYREGLSRSPTNVEFAAEEIRSLADLGETADAIVLADADLKTHGERRDVLLAAGYVTRAQKNPVEALRYIDRAVTLDPSGRETRHDRIMAIDEMGAPQIARQLADENPGVLTDAELRQIDGDAAAALVRWGVFEPPSEELRFAASDRAIRALDGLIARWSRAGDDARHDLLRARFDRMVALRDRVRMADVVAEFVDLGREGVDIPGYALVAAADAYLYLRQPETARDLYLRGLAVDPRNPETRLALFYTYVELDDVDAAYRQADSAAADQGVWLYLKGLADPIENPERATADLAAAEARQFADELAEANWRLTAMAESAPNNTRYLSALASNYSARGWPRLAAEEYEISRVLKPRDVTTETGQARNNLDLREYRAVEAQLADLQGRFPENLEVQRLTRLWQVHNMAEFRLDVEPTLASPSNVQGGSGLAINAQIFSAPIDYNWRIFGGEYVAHRILPEGEGTVTLRQSAVGTEYSDGDLVASLAGTINAYGPKVGATLDGGIDAGRAGVRAQATWSMNDYWQVCGEAELFARDMPLRALGNGITANAASTKLVYRESESHQLTLGAETMNFSDGNLRGSLAGQYSQRLITEPHFSVDAIFGLAATRDTANSNRPYFNPSQDALGTVGLSVKQTIYRRYEFIYDHHLVVTPGVYWQQGFGEGGAASVLYEHRLRMNDVFEAGLGVSFGRQPYDGNYDSTAAVLFNLRLRL